MLGACLGALPPAGWACGKNGEIKNGEPQCKADDSRLQEEEEEVFIVVDVSAVATAWANARMKQPHANNRPQG